MRFLWLLVALAAACSTVPPAPPPPPPVEAPAAAPEPRIKAALDGTWTGTADVSPFGPWPYTIVFRRSAAVIVGETPPPVGGQTALGGYQRLVLRRDAEGREICEYKASVKEGFAEGTLVLAEDDSGDARLAYCPTEGCSQMKLVFELDDAGRLHFETHLQGELHSDMALTVKAGASSPPPP